MAKIKVECEEFSTCLCLILDAACFSVGSFIIVGLMMAVMAISFALPLQLLNLLWVAKNGRFFRN